MKMNELEFETMWYMLRDIKTGYWLAIGGLHSETYTMIDDQEYATCWASKAECARKAGVIMDDFTHELAGITLEVVEVRA